MLLKPLAAAAVRPVGALGGNVSAITGRLTLREDDRPLLSVGRQDDLVAVGPDRAVVLGNEAARGTRAADERVDVLVVVQEDCPAERARRQRTLFGIDPRA